MLVYKITNRVNGKAYVGLTTKTLKQRWQKHGDRTVEGLHTPFYNALRKYGFENFKREILYETSSVEELRVCERALIASHGTLILEGYNVDIGGELGYVPSELRSRGESRALAKLNEEDIKFIRELKYSALSNPELRYFFELRGKKISRSVFRAARCGNTWAYLNEKYPPPRRKWNFHTHSYDLFEGVD